jgi:hypothetical protein
MTFSAETFEALALSVLAPSNGGKKLAASTELKNCRAFFGTSFVVCADLWNRLDPVNKISPGSEPKHLLWSLLFMKVYSSEKVHVRLVGGVDEKTFRKWAWLFVDAIASLKSEVVSVFVSWTFSNSVY